MTQEATASTVDVQSSAAAKAGQMVDSALTTTSRMIALFCLGLYVVGAYWMWKYTKTDPKLWYLNWRPGFFGGLSFLQSGVCYVLSCLMLLVGVGGAFSKRNVMGAIGGLICGLGILLISHDTFGRNIAVATKIASENCLQKSGYECRMNLFHRAYDLNQESAIGPDDLADYKEYVALRLKTGLEKPTGCTHVECMATQQRDLWLWELTQRQKLRRFMDK